MLPQLLRFVFAAALTAGPTFASAAHVHGNADDREPAFTGWLARVFSGNVRELDARHAKLGRELVALPAPVGHNTTPRLGWHSRRLLSPSSTVWAQIDLGGPRPIDTIALVPTSGEANGRSGAGYGFPLRFRVETSDDADFATRNIVGDFTAADVPNPGAFPFVVRGDGGRARYVRLTATQAWPRREDWIVALGEIIVLSGAENIAAGQPVRTSGSAVAPPTWDAANLTDEQSVLGPPVGPGPSPSDGFLAVHEQKPDVVKWVQVDLGRERAIDDVRLFPARPTDFADTPGSGFPARFRVEASATAAMADPQVLFDTGGRVFPNPGENTVTIPGHGVRARHVRVTATQLYDRGGSSYSFGLAELEVWSEGRNVARGATVTALDRFDQSVSPRWRPEYLVDGFNSRHPLLSLPAWLEGLARRQAVEREVAQIDVARSQAIDAVLALAIKASTGTMLALAFGVAWFVWRARVVRRRAVEELRQRIAGDLHDEIGSYLGSIGLLSEAARRQTEEAHARDDFAEIGRIAGHTGESLREIVWLLDPKPLTRAELVGRMRETAPGMLVGIACDFEVPATLRDGACRLEFARNVWLIFKETLHNAVKHSGARHVRIRISEPDGGFALQVTDDGRGFDERTIEPGRGLHNLRQRAVQLGASLRIASAPGQGTAVHLEIPRP